MTVVNIIAQLPVSNNIAQLPGLAHDGYWWLPCRDTRCGTKSNLLTDKLVLYYFSRFTPLKWEYACCSNAFDFYVSKREYIVRPRLPENAIRDPSRCNQICLKINVFVFQRNWENDISEYRIYNYILSLYFFDCVNHSTLPSRLQSTHRM